MRRSPSSRLGLLLTACLPALLVACSSTGKSTPSWQDWADRTPKSVKQNHWNLGSVAPRMIYALTGYRSEDWKSYRDFQYAEKLESNRTLHRHFLNRNPASPLQTQDRNYGQERPPHSIWPHPENYLHFTSIVVGGALSGSSAGSFIPIPIDSIIATFEEGGWEEFRAGFGEQEAPRSRHTRHNPPPTSEFKLNH